MSCNKQYVGYTGIHLVRGMLFSRLNIFLPAKMTMNAFPYVQTQYKTNITMCEFRLYCLR